MFPGILVDTLYIRLICVVPLARSASWPTYLDTCAVIPCQPREILHTATAPADRCQRVDPLACCSWRSAGKYSMNSPGGQIRWTSKSPLRDHCHIHVDPAAGPGMAGSPLVITDCSWREGFICWGGPGRNRSWSGAEHMGSERVIENEKTQMEFPKNRRLGMHLILSC